jgi:hypothetical protein
MAEIRINATGGVKLYDADDSHYAQIVAGTITSNVDAITLGHDTVTIADNLSLGSDSAVLKFGADGDTTLTHTDGTGLTLNSTNKLCFNDATQFIQGASGTVLDIAATDEIELTSTLVEVVGRLEVTNGVIFNEGSDNSVDFRVESATDANCLIVDGSGDRVGMGVAVPEAKLHIFTGDASIGPNGDGDELVVEGSGNAGISILSGASSTGSILFGDSGDDNIGQIAYNHSDEAMRVYVGAEFVGSFQTGGLNLLDDNGVMFGDAPDWWFGAAAGESTMNIYKGGTQGEGTNEGVIQWAVGDGAESYLGVTGGENGAATIYMYADQADDNNDKNRLMSKESNGFYIASYADGVFDNEFRVGDDLIHAEHTISVEAVDYAEYFEWKTELANDAKIEETYGLTVVLDGDKVRLAEAGEEAKVMGVVRPSKTSAIVGGDGIYWKDKYKKDVWGEYEKEAYTQVNWHILNAHGNSDKHHSYMKDRIPQYELIDSPEQDVKDWHLLDSNFKRDGDGNKIVLAVPTTDEEKAAAKYTERTTHRKTGKTLMRKIFSDSFDQSQTYVNRSKRRKEWCIVGLLGQVPVRDTAIVPTHWKLMKNLESGIDLYYIK